MIETNEHRVCKKIHQRRELGLSKYGVGVERTDLDLYRWLQHAQDEMMDAAIYLERAMAELHGGDVEVTRAGDMLTIKLDGTLLFSVPADWRRASERWQPVHLALSALAGEVLRLRGESDG
jgi:TPR repeat protein